MCPARHRHARSEDRRQRRWRGRSSALHSPTGARQESGRQGLQGHDSVRRPARRVRGLDASPYRRCGVRAQRQTDDDSAPGAPGRSVLFRDTDRRGRTNSRLDRIGARRWSGAIACLEWDKLLRRQHDRVCPGTFEDHKERRIADRRPAVPRWIARQVRAGQSGLDRRRQLVCRHPQHQQASCGPNRGQADGVGLCPSRS